MNRQNSPTKQYTSGAPRGWFSKVVWAAGPVPVRKGSRIPGLELEWTLLAVWAVVGVANLFV